MVDMKIIDIALNRISIPFRVAWHTPAGLLENRDSVIVEIEADSGVVGYSEIAPLSGFSKETLAEATEQVGDILNRIQSNSIPDSLADSKSYLSDILKQHTTAPSARFAVETAIGDVVSQHNSVPLSAWIGSTSHKEIPVNAVIPSGMTDIESAVKAAIDDGYKTIKLKVSAETVQDDINRIKQIRKLLTGDCRIRLDANRSFTPEEATRFADSIGSEKIEYIEEPFDLGDTDHLEQFASHSDIRIAADEGLMNSELRKRLIESDSVDVIILKPTLLGSLTECTDIASVAIDRCKTIVVTSCLESGIGVAACAHLASAVTDGRTACGLDTIRYLSKSVVEPELKIEHGNMQIPRIGLGVKSVLQ